MLNDTITHYETMWKQQLPILKLISYQQLYGATEKNKDKL
jgi:hypothetical protein